MTSESVLLGIWRPIALYEAIVSSRLRSIHIESKKSTENLIQHFNMNFHIANSYSRWALPNSLAGSVRSHLAVPLAFLRRTISAPGSRALAV